MHMSKFVRPALGSAAVLLMAAVGSVRAEPAAPAPAPEPSLPSNLFEQPLAAAPVAPTCVVAVVNGQEIKQAVVNQYLDRAIRASGRPVPPDQEAMVRASLGERILEDLVVQMLLDQQAKVQGVKVEADEVKKAIADIPMPGGKTLDQALQEQNMSRATLEEDVLRALRIDKLLKGAAGKAVAVTDEQTKKFYEENKARFEQPETATASHILIRTEEGADDKAKAAAKTKAEGIRKELVAGADFAEAAKKYSEDPGSKDKGGEYTFPRGMMVKAFEDAAFSQEMNAIGPVVETPFGYHIIKTTAKNPARTVAFEEAAPRLKVMLEQRAKGEQIRAYIEDLRAKAKISYPGKSSK